MSSFPTHLVLVTENSSLLMTPLSVHKYKLLPLKYPQPAFSPSQILVHSSIPSLLGYNGSLIYVAPASTFLPLTFKCALFG